MIKRYDYPQSYHLAFAPCPAWDSTLLTVDFSLRYKNAKIPLVPHGTALEMGAILLHNNVSSHAGLWGVGSVTPVD
ncbi:hypothetical protein AGMMS4957_15370 [Bacteroidia bacterium]|nr:hypothetical protein AGMMS4957_15370 [Bacteroidia bacterium]